MTQPERRVQEALEAAGDPAGAFLWRRVCRDLDGDLRVGIVARDEAVAARLRRRLEQHDRVEFVTLRLDEEGAGPAPTLGAQDRLLGVHLLLWATSITAPLGAQERDGMVAMVEAGAPAHRALVLADEELLAQVSDRPDEEAREVRERAEALCRESWIVLTGDELAGWLTAAKAQQSALSAAQRRTVSIRLLAEARRRADDAVHQATVELERVEALLASEDDALEQERKRGRRTAAHLLGAVRRQTERLLLDLREFLRVVEADVPAQVDALADLDVVRRTLPHWLQHIVESWMGERLSKWRADVLADLAELSLAEQDLDHAELLVPALHPSPVRTEAGWAHRLGVTAAVGSGAAMLMFGLWIPGLLAVTGGIAWSALGRRAAEASDRRALCDAAIDTLRRMGQDADRLLRDQIRALQDELERLGDDRANELGDSRSPRRVALEEERIARRQRARTLEETRGELDRRVAALVGEAST